MRRQQTINGVEDTSYGIVEAHYTEKGNAELSSWSEDYVAPVGETLNDFITDLAWFFAALTKPV
jgi:hypothetical protein